ncbi:alpha/beta hydrolase [Mariniphaga sediminis]|uniref:Alpha/beta hydrolase n=1 Tax=Mariniphaga sediminis TaxID=1628158 RepID=A0A399CUB9_9BACT|nr:alpha/beta hydrolase [Mariniphaga sediminis]RIH62748.1 alpha/beta hydrolase [Mariniphaga sediminis]
MQSIRSHIFIWMIKNRHLFKLKLRPEVVDNSFSVIEFRKGIDRTSAKMKLPKNISSEQIQINAINAEWIIPEGHEENKILLYIHGGGFISGSCLTHRMHVAKFANGSKLKSLVFDYRLAPENPFPAALEDCIEVYTWLLHQGYKSGDIVIGGESAGGTLTLSLLLALKEKGIDFPKAAFSISPVTDLRCLADSFQYNANNDIAPMGSWNVWTQYYIANNNPLNPLLSPQFGNYEGLPPIFICVGTHEIHLNDCENVARIANEQGVNVRLRKWDKMIHAFPILSPFFPEAKQAMTEICEFARNSLLDSIED